MYKYTEYGMLKRITWWNDGLFVEYKLQYIFNVWKKIYICKDAYFRKDRHFFRGLILKSSFFCKIPYSTDTLISPTSD